MERVNGLYLPDLSYDYLRHRESGIAVVEAQPQYKPQVSNGYRPKGIILNGLVLHLPLYQLLGAKIKSRDSYAHLCTPTGTNWVASGRNFDGLDDWISVPDHTVLDNVGNITVEAWVNPDVLDNGRVLSKRVSGTDTANYIMDDGGAGVIRFRFFNASWRTVTSISAMAAGAWVHLTGTYNLTTLAIYFNGVSDNTAAISNAMVANSAVLSIGADEEGTASFWNGLIGEVRIYNRALSAAEVAHNYAVTRWRYK